MEDRILYRKAIIMALKYGFVDTVEELSTLTNALYQAMRWGKGVK